MGAVTVTGAATGSNRAGGTGSLILFPSRPLLGAGESITPTPWRVPVTGGTFPPFTLLSTDDNTFGDPPWCWILLTTLDSGTGPVTTRTGLLVPSAPTSTHIDKLISVDPDIYRAEGYFALPAGVGAVTILATWATGVGPPASIPAGGLYLDTTTGDVWKDTP